jgi:acetyltransferase-like isoleucine patch superfamily enzyme
MRSTPLPIHHTPDGFQDHEGFFSRVLTRLNTFWVAATYPFAGKGRDVSLHYASEISRSLAPHLRVGNRVEIGRHTWFHTWCTLCVENNHEVKIIIEDDCRIAARCTITAKNSIHLERDVVLASDVLIMDHAHAYQVVSRPISVQGATSGGRIRIQEGCRIGRGAAVLCDKGELVLGRNCVVAPGAVVTRSFPADSMLAGNPARAIRESGTNQACAEQKSLGPPDGAGKTGGPKQAGEASRNSASLRRHGQESLFVPRRPTKEGPDDSSSGDLPGGVNEDPLTWFSRMAGKLRTLWLNTYPFVSLGKGVWAHYSCHVARSAAPFISLGEGVGLGRDARLEICATPGTNSPILVLEQGSGLQRRCVISARNRIHVMRNVMFGPSVLVMDHGRAVQGDAGNTGRAQDSRGGTIRIEEDCWIGFGAVIICERGELVIGRHSVVGANSVVTRSIPPYSVVVGDPARIVKQYDFSESKWVLGCIRPAAGAGQAYAEPATSALS